MAETFDVQVEEGGAVVTRRVSAPSEEEAQKRALAGKGLAIRRQPLTLGQPPPSGGAPEPAPPVDNSQLQAQIPPELRGEIKAPMSTFDQGIIALNRYGPPALAGVLTGGMSFPVQMGAQLGVTALQQALGVEPRRGAQPYLETVLADLAGRGAYGALMGLARRLLPATPPGQLYQTTQQRDRLRFRADRQQELNDATQRQYQAEIDRTMGEGMQRQAGVQRDIDVTLGQGMQQEDALKGSLARFEQATGQSLDFAEGQKIQVKEGFNLLQTGLEKVGDDIRRYKNLQQVRLGEARVRAASSARTWLETLPVPNEDDLARLYGEVDRFNGNTIPNTLLDPVKAAQKALRDKEARIAGVVPDAVNPRLQDAGTTPRALSAKGKATAAPEGPEPGPSLTADPYKRPDGRWKVPLKDVPSTELELQDLMRQPDAKGRWGINLSDDELFGEFDALLGRAESGSTRLKNRHGLTTSEQAQRAHELGFLDSPDTDSLLRALDESIFGGRPVYSTNRRAPDVQYDARQVAAPDDVPATSFQAIRETLSRVGETIGDLRVAVSQGRTGAREELRAWSSIYGALQQSLDEAVSHFELTPAARQQLKLANDAFKVRATVQDLRGLFEGKFRTPEGGYEQLNPGPIIDALRRPEHADLRQKLEDIGVLGKLDGFLTDLQARLAAPKDAVKQARELEAMARQLSKQMSREEQLAVARYLQSTQRLSTRLDAARADVGEEVAASSQQTDARVGMLTAQQQAIQQQTEARAGMLQSQADVAQREGAETLRDLERQRASLPVPTFNNSLMFGYAPAATGLAAGALSGSPRTGLAVTGGFEVASLVARMLMTPQGQKVVGRVLEASGGRFTPAAVVVLSQAAKDPALRLAEAPGRQLRESLGVPALGGQ
jgi:hypothetical protein